MRAAGRALALLLLGAGGCTRQAPPPAAGEVVVAIENSPNSLDPRLGTDAMAERIGGLLFDALLRKDDHFNLQPWLAERWEQVDGASPDGARDWVFHLRDGVRFADGRPLEAADAAWTVNSMLDGSLVTSKAGAFASVERAEAPDRLTLRLRMRRADASLLFNLSDGLFGVVPRGAGKQFAEAPVGSGPFVFVRAAEDRDVEVRRNPAYWAGAPRLPLVRFAVVPDAVTVALELQKGSVDVASNELTLDMVHALSGTAGLRIETGPGAPVMYLNFNTAAGPLADARVRQAIRCTLDRQEIVDAVWRGQATLAQTLLPATHWAAAPPDLLAHCERDPARAAALLDAAGFRPDSHGVRLRLEMKTSQDESTRLLAQVLAAQMRAAGIVLTLRAAEFGTFYADVTAGRFQMYALRWIGSNEAPDIFRYALGGDRFPPRGGNRGRYANPRLDALLARAADEDDASRRADYLRAQQIVADDVPVIPLWYPNNEVVHTARVHGARPRLDGSFGFLREAWLEP